jgi:hypothetical protein
MTAEQLVRQLASGRKVMATAHRRIRKGDCSQALAFYELAVAKSREVWALSRSPPALRKALLKPRMK